MSSQDQTWIACHNFIVRSALREGLKEKLIKLGVLDEKFPHYSLLKSPLKWKFIFFLICLKPSLIIVHRNCCWFLPERKTLRLREQIAGGECSTGRWRQEENQILCTGSAPSKSEDTWSEGESIVCSNPFPDIKDLDEKRKISLSWLRN